MNQCVVNHTNSQNVLIRILDKLNPLKKLKREKQKTTSWWSYFVGGY